MPTALAHATPSTTDAVSRSRAMPALAAVLFGICIFIAAGFAGPSVLHNATHDTRHALGLPCH